MRSISKLSGMLVLAGLTGGLSFSASAIDLTKLPPPSDKTGLTYTNDILPLFKASCFRCHAGKRHSGGVNLETLDGVLNGSENGPIVTVGDSTKSQLVIAISGLDPKSAMPPKRRPRRNGGGPGGPGGPPPDAQNRPADGPGMAPPPSWAGSAMGTNVPAGGPAGGPGGPGGPGGRPPGPPLKPLTPEEVGLVRAWIDQGAK